LIQIPKDSIDDAIQSGRIYTTWLKDPAMLFAQRKLEEFTWQAELMEYSQQAPLCFAATILSRKPIVAIRLKSVNHQLFLLMVKNSHCCWCRAMMMS
jgi:hypothetical protein